MKGERHDTLAATLYIGCWLIASGNSRTSNSLAALWDIAGSDTEKLLSDRLTI